MRILITSASSLLGSYVANFFLEQGYFVEGTYRRINSKINNLMRHPNFTGLPVSFNIGSKLYDFTGKFDVIINSTGAYLTKGVDENDIINANIKMMQSIERYLAISNSTKLVINFSTLSVYGNLSNIPFIDHHTDARPIDLYGTSKLLAEQILNSIKIKDLKVVHLRFPVVLGSGAHRAWLPSILQTLKQNSSLSLINPHKHYSCCTTMLNVANFCLHLINTSSFERFPEVMPLGAIPDISISDIVRTIMQKLESSSSISNYYNDNPCVFIDSSNAVSSGFKPLLASEAIKYWLDQELP